MPEAELIGKLGVWEGYTVRKVRRYEAGVRGLKPQVWVELSPKPSRVMTCNGCGKADPRRP